MNLCRWKGENVATTEVSDIVSMLDFVEEANVYGVRVPGLPSPRSLRMSFLRRDVANGLLCVLRRSRGTDRHGCGKTDGRSGV